MVRFVECTPPATDAEVDSLEARLGFRVPNGIRKLVTTANGGRPVPDIYSDSEGAADVSECLPLSDTPGSIWWTYELIVISKKAAPKHFLPFAHDSGGNLFLVDCTTEEAAVYFLLHDPEFRLCALGVGLEDFWSRLRKDM